MTVAVETSGTERIVLRPLQERAVAAVRALLRAGHRRVMLVAPTGFGKTAVTAELLRRVVERGKRALFLVHRREIVRDTARRLERAGVPCAIVMGDEPVTPGVSVLVCSVQTLAARGARPPADVLFWDECQHASALTYRAIAADYPQALHVGLTATPERADGVGLADAFDALTVAASTRELIDAGLLVPCDVVAPPACLEEGVAWEELGAWQQHAAGRSTLIFAANVNHALTVTARFCEAGIAAACIHGETPKRERDQALAAFKAGEILVVVNVFCLTEGFDAPRAEVCMVARGCGSAATFLQMVGRVLRTAPGKSRALLLDLRGVVHLHGMPDEEREYSLEGDPIKRKKPLPLKTCPTCGATFLPAPVCPRCGHVFPPPELPPVLRDTLGTVREVGTRAERLADWLRFVREAKERGYKPGWAAHKFREAWQAWPPRNFPKFEEVE